MYWQKYYRKLSRVLKYFIGETFFNLRRFTYKLNSIRLANNQTFFHFNINIDVQVIRNKNVYIIRKVYNIEIKKTQRFHFQLSAFTFFLNAVTNIDTEKNIEENSNHDLFFLKK